MQKKTYGDKQREAQRLKKQEELRARVAAKTDAPKTEAVKETRKADKSVRRPA